MSEQHLPGECEDADCWAHSEDDYPPPVYDAAGLRIMAERCSTCIFRPGNLMRLNPGRLRDMVTSTAAGDTNVICHQTLDQNVSALCAGSVEQQAGQMVRIAERLGQVVLVQPEAVKP